MAAFFVSPFAVAQICKWSISWQESGYIKHASELQIRLSVGLIKANTDDPDVH